MRDRKSVGWGPIAASLILVLLAGCITSASRNGDRKDQRKFLQEISGANRIVVHNGLDRISGVASEHEVYHIETMGEVIADVYEALTNAKTVDKTELPWTLGHPRLDWYSNETHLCGGRWLEWGVLKIDGGAALAFSSQEAERFKEWLGMREGDSGP